MSRQPIALSPDLLRLQNEGYDLDVRDGYLLVRDVPYVDGSRNVRKGILISKLRLSGDRTDKPTDHVAYWTGEHPCHADGSKIRAFENGSAPQSLGDGIQADCTFSAKADYRDYHHKMTTYIAMIAGEANKLDPKATAQTFPVIPETKSNGIFKYEDTASSRAGIGALNKKFEDQRIGIVGLGGSGSYVLDFVSKTSVATIRVFDADVFSQHNAFRAPGAPSIEDLAAKPQKVARFHEIYSRMRNGIDPRDELLDEANLTLLDDLQFVFLCLDAGDAKRRVVAHLNARSIPFVEVGMGIVMNDGALSGIVRVTTSVGDTQQMAEPHISYDDAAGVDNEYATNIQVAELNALSAALAVFSWKQTLGFYAQSGRTFYRGFSLVSGEIAAEFVP